LAIARAIAAGRRDDPDPLIRACIRHLQRAGAGGSRRIVLAGLDEEALGRGVMPRSTREADLGIGSRLEAAELAHRLRDPGEALRRPRTDAVAVDRPDRSGRRLANVEADRDVGVMRVHRDELGAATEIGSHGGHRGGEQR
jgi:hypothetical protein